MEAIRGTRDNGERSPCIDVRGLIKLFETGRGRRRRRVEAVRDLDLTVESGERLAYIGPNWVG